MSAKLLFLVIFIFIQSLCHCQTITIIGKLIDSYSKEPLIGALISIEKEQTITNSNGNFKINFEHNTIRKSSIYISFIGYKDTTFLIGKDYNDFQLIQLDRTSNLLPELVVHTGTKAIIQKIIANICNNYSTTPFNTLGYFTSKVSVNDTGYISCDTSLIESHTPSYCKKGKSQSKVIQHKFSEIILDTLITSQNIIGAYNVLNADYILTKSLFLNESTIDNFSFRRNKDSVINGRVFYNIDFLLNGSYEKASNVGGTIKVDAKKMAITSMRLRFTETNIKNFTNDSAMLKNLYTQFSAEYKRINNKYCFHSSRGEILRILKNKISNPVLWNCTLSYQALKIDSTNVKKISLFHRIRAHNTLKQYRGRTGDYNWKEIEEILNKKN